MKSLLLVFDILLKNIYNYNHRKNNKNFLFPLQIKAIIKNNK